MGIVEIKVMNDAVAECRTEYLALLGIVNDESIWKARLCTALSANRRTTAPCYEFVRLCAVCTLDNFVFYHKCIRSTVFF